MLTGQCSGPECELDIPKPCMCAKAKISQSRQAGVRIEREEAITRHSNKDDKEKKQNDEEESGTD